MLPKNNFNLLHMLLYVASLEIGWEFDGSETDLVSFDLENEGVEITSEITPESINIIKNAVEEWKKNTIENYL